MTRSENVLLTLIALAILACFAFAAGVSIHHLIDSIQSSLNALRITG